MRFLIRLAFLILLAAGAIWGWEKLKAANWFRGDTETNHHVVLEKMVALGKLELVRYQFRDVVEHEIVRPLMPNSSALLIVRGEAIGCLDLTKIGPADIASFGTDTLIVRLPEPELCGFRIDHANSKVYDTNFSFLGEAALVDEAYRKAETQVRESALQGGILEQTRANAEKILKPLLESVSGRKVLLRYPVRAELAPAR